jgi:RsiW-degrading membrane proteinase PrsW (M82 family)
MSASAQSACPVGVDGFFQPRRAAFWVLLLFIAIGAQTTVTMFSLSFRVVPVTVLLGIAVWTLYTIPILLRLRSLDLFEQHPRSGFALAFAWGGLGAVYLAVPANQAVFALLSKLVSPEFSATWGAAIAGPTDEEPLKLLGVILLVLVARNQFRTIVSVMALGAMSGLGFQVVENLFYTLSGALNHSSPDQIAPVIKMFIVRGIVCGAWSHTGYTMVAAFGVGYFVTRHHEPLAKRLAVAAGALLLAWSMHFFWNSQLLASFFSDGAWALAYIPLKGCPVVIALLLLWRVAQHEESAHLANLATHFVPPDLITPDERPALGATATRSRLRKAMKHAHGRAAARALTQLQKAQLRLVQQHGHAAPAAEIASQSDRVRQLRAQLAALAPASAASA